MQAPTILEMKHIIKQFPGVLALDDVAFDVREGEVHALVGENGPGKSTLMNVLSGMFPADSGEIIFKGKAIKIHSIREALQLGISMIHQELVSVPALTVAANIYLGKEETRAFPQWINEKAITKKAQAFLDDMEVGIDATARMGSLSTAQQQMVEIAKAITNNASIIIMDEPTSAITETEILVLFRIIRQLQQRGVAVIYISHKLDEIFEIADRVTVQRDGRHIATKDISETDENEVISLMVGREVSNFYPKEEVEPGEELLRVEGLGGAEYQDVSFTLHRGEILGFSGLMGSGRTEIMRGIYGMDKTSAGSVFVKGKKVQICRPSDAIRAGIGLVTEDRKKDGLVLGMSVQDNITLSAIDKCIKRRFIVRKKERELTAQEIKRFNIKTPSQQQAVVKLSGGNQQKVVLGKALLNNPDIIILDEPTRGIDVGAKSEIHRFISSLAAHGKGILMVSSEMPEILGMSDRIMVVHEGRLKGELRPADATQERIMQVALSTPQGS